MAKPASRSASNSALFSFDFGDQVLRAALAGFHRQPFDQRLPAIAARAARPGAIYRIQACSSPWPVAQLAKDCALLSPSARQMNVGAPAIGIR